MVVHPAPNKFDHCSLTHRKPWRTFCRQVRNLIADHRLRLGFELVQDSRAAGRWQTTCRGDYFVTGVRGPITGRRADLAIIDDPIKSQAEVTNVRLRDKLWTWFQSELLTRLKPGGRVVLVMTRWHEDDISGRLQAPGHPTWRILRLAGWPRPTIQSVVISEHPYGQSGRECRNCSVAAHRWENTSGVQCSNRLPARSKAAYSAASGITCLNQMPDISSGKIVRAWDLASTAATGLVDPDWTVGLKLFAAPTGGHVILDVVRMRGSPNEVMTTIVSTADRDGKAIPISLPEDPGQAGKAQIAYMAGKLVGYYTMSSRETGSKLPARCPLPLKSEARNLAILHGSWNRPFLEELRSFPDGQKDDQVDALSRAFDFLTRSGSPLRRLITTHLAR